MNVNIFTIGFTQSSAQNFFNRLIRANVKKILDVRLHNSSQLSGFAKSADLAYFLKSLGNIEYEHEPLLAPTDEILKPYKKGEIDWLEYERCFIHLMTQRNIEARLTPEKFRYTCLLCSEATPHHCHRRLVCEYLNDKWQGTLSVHHL